MNLTELYEIQGGLDYHIRDRKGLQDQDLSEEKILSLQVELGELANEWRGFKFWSEDQEPRREKMLEEYADCFSFILSLGLEMGFEQGDVMSLGDSNTTRHFSNVFETINNFRSKQIPHNYFMLIGAFFGLGRILGFTEEEIETAYKIKNAENHLRQRNGY